jgi:hypothetical protein
LAFTPFTPFSPNSSHYIIYIDNIDNHGLLHPGHIGPAFFCLPLLLILLITIYGLKVVFEKFPKRIFTGVVLIINGLAVAQN